MNKYIALVLMAQLLLFPCFGQHFTYHSSFPFGIRPADSTRFSLKIMFSDYDGDGDLDLFLTGLDHIDTVETSKWESIHYYIEMQENIGDRWHPQFGPWISVYEDFPFPLGYFFPSIGDLNHDGQTDFIVNGIVDYIGNRTMIYCKKNATGTMPEFEVTRFDSMDLYDFVPSSFFIPELVDLDADGDLDILMSGYDPPFGPEEGENEPTFYYAKNIGTVFDPQFIGWFKNPYGLTPNPLTEITVSGDIDNDGDIDVLGTLGKIPPDSINYMYIHLNTPGPNGYPLFNTVLESPFGLPVGIGAEQFLSPNLVDIDGDGDLDLFVFQISSDSLKFNYYENNLCTGVVDNVSVTLCEGDSIVIGGNAYTSAGNDTIIIQSSEGCNTVIFLSITLIPVYSISLNESICEGETFVIGNESFIATGNYTVYLVAENGCDSLVSLSLIVNENFNTNLNESLCEGESYQIGDKVFTLPGNYEVALSSQTGCDSIIFLSLIINPTYTTNLSESLCEGESYQIGNEVFALPGNYEVVLNSQTGCDSTVFLSLVINPNYTTNLNKTLCAGETYQIGEEVFTISGHYDVVLTSQAGCDSTISLDLSFIDIDPSVAVLQNTLTANQTGASYQWINCDSGESLTGATNQSYEATASGNYAVSITDISGCSVVSACVSIVISGLKEDALSISITLYPNPNRGLIYVLNNTRYPVSSMTMINLSGKVMGEFFLNGKNQADISSLGTGVYFVKIKMNGFDIIRKLILL